MSTTTGALYALYTIATGVVFNIVMWDGVSPLPLPDGAAAVADPDCKYPIDSTYTAPASGS